MGTWKFLTFPTPSLGMLPIFLVSILRRGASRTTFSEACLPSFGQFFFKFSETVKIWLCVMDLFIEKLVLKILPKSFKKQRSYDNFKHLVKKLRILFLAPWTPNFRIFGFSKTDLVVHDREIEWRLPHRNWLYGSRDLKGGPNRSPLTQGWKSRRLLVFLHTGRFCTPKLWLERNEYFVLFYPWMTTTK